MRRSTGASTAMAEAAATQLPSFLHQARRGRVRSRILSTGYKEQKSRQSGAATLGPADARSACPRGRAPLRARLRSSIPQGPKKSTHSRSQHLHSRSQTGHSFQCLYKYVLLGNYLINFDLLKVDSKLEFFLNKHFTSCNVSKCPYGN
jgi:hypothetical protein